MLKRMNEMCAIAAAVATFFVSTHAVATNAQQSPDPISAARFGISIDGVEIGVFSQLISEAGAGTDAGGQVITLTGGRTQGMELAAWHELVILGDVAAARKNATIIMYNSSGSPVKTYHIENAWPSKVALDGSGRGDIRTATVMLIYENMRVQTGQ